MFYSISNPQFQQKATDDVDMEQALETQRLKLLRLLAGLAVALSLVSLAPAVSMLPRWVRTYVASVLIRAEIAVHNLVIVTACGLLRKQGAGSATGFSFPPLPFAALPEDAASCGALLRRINLLRAVLQDLPRHAKQMIARLRKPKSEPREPLPYWEVYAGVLGAPDALCLARIERPPDKRYRAISMTKELAPS